MTHFKVKVTPAQVEFPAIPTSTLLVSAEAAGVILPSSCRNGTCRTCICKLLSEEVRYLIEWPGLSADEKREGWILPCVAVPKSNLVIEAPSVKVTL